MESWIKYYKEWESRCTSRNSKNIDFWQGLVFTVIYRAEQGTKYDQKNLPYIICSEILALA